MRRCGTLKGHYSSKYKRIQILAAATLHRKPGIMSALNALQLYRNDCSSGKICVAPKHAFVPNSLSWLDCNGEKVSRRSKNSRNSFRLTGVALRPPANGYNHPYIYIYLNIATSKKTYYYMCPTKNTYIYILYTISYLYLVLLSNFKSTEHGQFWSLIDGCGNFCGGNLLVWLGYPGPEKSWLSQKNWGGRLHGSTKSLGGESCGTNLRIKVSALRRYITTNIRCSEHDLRDDCWTFV